MTETINFTNKRVNEWPTPAAGRTVYRDRGCPGLEVRVTTTGTKSASVYRSHHGRPVRITLGKWGREYRSVAALRDAARRVLADFAKTVAEHRQAREEPTLSVLWDLWRDYAEQHKKPVSQREDQRHYKQHLAAWGSRRLSAVTRRDVTALHRKIGREHGRYAANRLLSLLSAMYGKAHELGDDVLNPCRHVRRFPEPQRDRWLDGEELRRLFASLNQEDDCWQNYFMLLLLTGVRCGNLRSARWADIHLDNGLWRLPDTKGGVPIVVVLVQPAVEILRKRLADSNGSTWVFPSQSSSSGHIESANRVWHRVRDRAGLEDVRIHDLRRTLGSWQATGGSSLPTIGKSLGHSSLSATAVYARLSNDAVRESVGSATQRMLEAAGASGGR